MNTKEQTPQKILLPRGGCKAIANELGYKPHTVWMVLNGLRKNEKIVEAAKVYLSKYGTPTIKS